MPKREKNMIELFRQVLNPPSLCGATEDKLVFDIFLLFFRQNKRKIVSTLQNPPLSRTFAKVRGYGGQGRKNMANIIKKPESAAALLANIQKFTGGQSSLVKKENRQTSFGKKLQVVFLFDTTGSMYPYYDLGRKQIGQIVLKVVEKHRQVKFCYLAYKNHGDETEFFDGENPFFASSFTSDPEQIKLELEKVRNGGGGDGLTALECVFHHLNTKTEWLASATKIVVLIGDMPPHGVIDQIGKCPKEHNYQDEIAKMKAKGIKVYSVFCFEENSLISSRIQQVKNFFKDTASKTDGRYLELAEIEEIVDLLTGICMKETGHLNEFIKDLEKLQQLSDGKKRLLLALK